MKRNRRRNLLFLGVVFLFSTFFACKIPATLAPTIAKEMIDGWHKVQTVTQTSKIWPDVTKNPDEVYKILYRDRRLFSSDQGFRYDLLKPSNQAGFTQGAIVGSFWIRLSGDRGLLRIDGLPGFDPDKGTRLLTRIVRENLEIMDFDLTRMEWKGIKAVKIIATPKPWRDKYYFQSETISDPSTKVIKLAKQIDQKGRVGQMWEVTEYERDLPHDDGIYKIPDPAKDEPFLVVDRSKAKPWPGGTIDGKAPWLHGSKKATHTIHDSPFGPVLISDYSDGLNLMLVVQYSAKAPFFHVPWAKEVKMEDRSVWLSLISGYAFADFKSKDFHGFILAQDNFHHVLHLFEGLEQNR